MIAQRLHRPFSSSALPCAENSQRNIRSLRSLSAVQMRGVWQYGKLGADLGQERLTFRLRRHP